MKKNKIKMLPLPIGKNAPSLRREDRYLYVVDVHFLVGYLKTKATVCAFSKTVHGKTWARILHPLLFFCKWVAFEMEKWQMWLNDVCAWSVCVFRPVGLSMQR